MYSKRFIFFIASFVLLMSTVRAQKMGEWSMYPSYANPTKCTTVGNCVYALCGSGNLLKYDVEEDVSYTYDYYTSLSDIHIQYIAYCADAKCVILVYDNGNIDLMDENDNIHNLAALKNSTLTNKTVYNIRVVDDIVYLCTGFGLVEVKPSECLFGETYRFNYKVSSLTARDNYIYILTPTGTKRALKGSNFHSADSWTSYPYFPAAAVDSCKADGYYWRAEGFNGLRGYAGYKDTEPANNGPAMNGLSYDLFYKFYNINDKLYVVGGNHTTSSFTNFNAGYLDDEGWHNISEKTYKEAYPSLLRKNIVSVAIDPKDENHLFLASVNNGLLEYKDGNFVQLYNRYNAPLVVANPASKKPDEYVCVSNLHYDDNNNLWMTNAFSDSIMKIMRPDGSWVKINCPAIAGTRVIHDIVHTSLGYNFMLCSEEGGAVFGFTLGSTLGTLSKQKYREGITNEDGTSYTPDYFYCLAEDRNEMLWVGTSDGLFVIEDQDDFFDSSTFCYQQIKVNRNDGSGLADYRLSGVEITSIIVDPANQKWIGTKGNGVYLLSEDGQEMIEHFQAADSKLLSDNVSSMYLDNKTGLLYIATDAGLCSYQTASLEPEETLEYSNILIYPNPVVPGYNGSVIIKGLTLDADVKIVTTGGQVVWGGMSNGGICTWNCCDMRGNHVASGIYHVVANTSDGEKAVVGRVVVMK